MQLQNCLVAGTVCGCSLDVVCRGGFLGRGGCPRLKRRLSSPIFLRWEASRAPGGRQVICPVDIACRKLQVCFLKPGVVEYCVENLLLLCINPSTLYGFDLANRALRSWSLNPSHGFAVPAPFALHGFDLTNRAARSWSLTHTQGSLWCPAPLGVQCKLAGATPQSR